MFALSAVTSTSRTQSRDIDALKAIGCSPEPRFQKIKLRFP